MSTPQEPVKTPRDPRSWLFLAAALLPFLIATLYMTYKPVPQRIPRTHGGSAKAVEHDAGALQAPSADTGARSDSSR